MTGNVFNARFNGRPKLARYKILALAKKELPLRVACNIQKTFCVGFHVFLFFSMEYAMLNLLCA